MSEKTVEQTYYRIRFPDKAGTGSEFYSSNNGTDRWYELSKVKALISRGRPYGYRSLVPFENYEVVEVSDVIRRTQKVIPIAASFKPEGE